MATLARSSRLASPSSSAMPTFCCAVSDSNRLCAWKMKPIWRRTATSSSAVNVASSCPRTLTDPSCTERRPPTRVSSVVLPEPEGPVRIATSPGLTPSMQSSRARLLASPSPKWCVTAWTSTAGTTVSRGWADGSGELVEPASPAAVGAAAASSIIVKTARRGRRPSPVAPPACRRPGTWLPSSPARDHPGTTSGA